MTIIFETERLKVRHLVLDDLAAFHHMQSDVEVMKFVKPKVLDFEGNKKDLQQLIQRYSRLDNDFWIFAIERKSDATFLGSVALVKTDGEDEIGYRLLRKFWNLGYATEATMGLLLYCKALNLKEVVAYAAYENKASINIIEKLGFRYIADHFAEDLNPLERKYKLIL